MATSFNLTGSEQLGVARKGSRSLPHQPAMQSPLRKRAQSIESKRGVVFGQQSKLALERWLGSCCPALEEAQCYKWDRCIKQSSNQPDVYHLGS